MNRRSILGLVSAGLVFLFASAGRAQLATAAATPDRAKGISMQMLPKRVADLGPMQWGLVVSHAGDWKPQKKPIVFQTAQQFLDFVRA